MCGKGIPFPQSNTSFSLPLVSISKQQCTTQSAETGEAEDDYFRADNEDIDEPDSISLLNTILSGTARLNVVLPAATVLGFTIFSPLITKDGQCSTLDPWLMGFFLALSAASCIFFAFTDSFRTRRTGRLYYGNRWIFPSLS